MLLLLHPGVADVSSAPRISRALKNVAAGNIQCRPPSFRWTRKSRKMSKKNSDGDVLANRLSLGLAKHQKLLASWMGSQPDTQLANDTSKNEDEDSELKQDFYGHDR
jgi:hypothetical protein